MGKPLTGLVPQARELDPLAGPPCSSGGTTPKTFILILNHHIVSVGLAYSRSPPLTPVSIWLPLYNLVTGLLFRESSIGSQ